MPEKGARLAPTVTAVGGLFILAGALRLWVGDASLARVFPLGSLAYLGGVLLGILTVAVGLLMATLSGGRHALGAVALGAAAASIPLAFGGFVVGFALVAVGGASALSPRRAGDPAAGAPTPGRAPPWS